MVITLYSTYKYVTLTLNSLFTFIIADMFLIIDLFSQYLIKC